VAQDTQTFSGAPDADDDELGGNGEATDGDDHQESHGDGESGQHGWQSDQHDQAEFDPDDPELAAEVDAALQPPSAGLWQESLGQYFPRWHNTLALPRIPYRQGVFVFKVWLGKIWRRLAAPDTATLADLSSAILDSVRFDEDHLYRFTIQGPTGAPIYIDGPVADEDPWADETILPAWAVRVGQLPVEVGASIDYLFDWGDSWNFRLVLEDVRPTDPRLKRIKKLDAAGKAPKQYDSSW
jgi:hypothetical protein